MIGLCRTCGESTDTSDAKLLYEVQNSKLLEKLKELTNLPIDNDYDMPHYICSACEDNLEHAVAFRNQCIEIELNLQVKKRNQSIKSQRLTENIIVYDVDPLFEEAGSDFEAENEEEEQKFEIIEDDIKKEQTVLYDKIDVNIATKRWFKTDKGDLENFQGDTKYQKIPVCKKLEADVIDLPETDINVNKDTNKKFDIKQNKKDEPTNKLKAEIKTKTNWKELNEEETYMLKRQRSRKDLVCDQCGRYFTCPGNFKLHMLRHTGVKNFICDQCPKKFYTLHLLTTHRRIYHEGEHPYACKYCERAFKDSSTRTMHERSHTNERPYKCQTCSKSFRSAGRLKEHAITHTGERNFRCEICNQAFSRKKCLSQHYKSKQHSAKEQTYREQCN